MVRQKQIPTENVCINLNVLNKIYSENCSRVELFCIGVKFWNYKNISAFCYKYFTKDLIALRVNVKFRTMTCNPTTAPLGTTLSSSPTHISPSAQAMMFIFLQPHWTPQCSYNIPGTALPESLWTCCSLWSERSSCQISKQIVLFLSVDSSLEVLCKIAKCFNTFIFFLSNTSLLTEREGIYVSTQLIHLIIQQKWTQHDKVLTVQS